MPLAASPVTSRLLATVPGFVFPSLCTIEAYTAGEPDAYGSTIDTWEPVEDHTDIPCRLAPVTGVGASTGATSGEVRTGRGEYDIDARTVVLAGYYPDVTESHRAVVDGVTWGVVDASHDGNGVMTRLRVRRTSDDPTPEPEPEELGG